MVLLLVGFVGGLLTGISPCILPVLPVVFFGGATPGATDASTTRARPFLVVLGLTISFAAFTLFGAFVLSLLHLPSDAIRWAGLIVLVLLGLAMLIPQLERVLERPFSWIPQREVKPRGSGLLLGMALGAVFVPCAGPVLAAITVAGASGTFGLGTLGLTLAFAIGTAIPLLFFALAGRQVTSRLRAFRKRQRLVRSISGVVMIGLALALTFNLTDLLQTAIPDYTQALSDSLQKSVSAAQPAGATGAKGSLTACQTAAYSGGSGLDDCGKAPAFAGISTWLNTADDAPLTLSGLKGHVVLVDFWAYSCINCQRELPHAEAWARAYAADGLTVVGVHTPEYAFERVASNVQDGAKRLGLTFPIAVDDAYSTWNAYSNQSWPASYLIDATGTIRHVSLGEGDYPHEEALIRQLLAAANPTAKLPAATDLPDTTPDDADQSPESYLGSGREQGYSGTVSYDNGTRRFTPSDAVPTSSYQLSGTWTIGTEDITSGRGAAITVGYHASKVYLDVGGTGTVTVTEGGRTRTIQVSGAPNIRTVSSHASPTSGTATIRVSKGLSAYSFTFG